MTETTVRKFVSKLSLVVAVLLVAAKVVAWFITGSVALLTSAVDAMVDVAASFVTFVGVRYAERPADHHHRYGHGKGEAIAGLTQAVFLAGAALVLAFQSIDRIVYPSPLVDLNVGMWVIIASLIAAAMLVWLQSWALKRDNSTAIAADRAHYVTDIAVNAAVLLALGITKLTGWERADPIIAIMISAYILGNARHIARGTLLQLLDRELPDADRKLIMDTVMACEGAKAIHDLRTRYAGDRSFVEYHLEVDGHLTVDQGHAIGDVTEAAVAKALPGKTEVTCHLEPFGIIDERLDNKINERLAEP